MTPHHLDDLTDEQRMQSVVNATSLLTGPVGSGGRRDTIQFEFAKVLLTATLEVERLKAELAEAVANGDRAKRYIGELVNEMRAMRPVVEAAESWTVTGGSAKINDGRLTAAVDDYLTSTVRDNALGERAK